jgi:hypothetical protein
VSLGVSRAENRATCILSLRECDDCCARARASFNAWQMDSIDNHGVKLADFDGRDVRDSHGSKIAGIEDVKKMIDGIGGVSLVAMWLFFVR